MEKQSLTSRFLPAASVLFALAISGTHTSFAHEGEDHDADKSAGPALSTQEKRVVAALESYAVAVESGDIAQIEKHVVTDEGFSSLEGAFMDSGWESYRKHLAGELPMFKDTTYHISNVRPYVSGGLAYATMDYSMNFTIVSDRFEGGEHAIDMKGKATMVLSKSGKEWKIRHMHTAREEAKKPAAEGSNPH